MEDYSLILFPNESLTIRTCSPWAYWSAAEAIWRLGTKWRMRSVNLCARHHNVLGRFCINI